MLLKVCTGCLEMLEMHVGRQFQSLLAVNAKDEERERERNVALSQRVKLKK